MQKTYIDLPPLEDILDRLPFAFTENDNFDELGARVEVLSYILTDIPRFIAAEGHARRSGALDVARSTVPVDTVTQVVDQLMVMHGRISERTYLRCVSRTLIEFTQMTHAQRI